MLIKRPGRIQINNTPDINTGPRDLPNGSTNEGIGVFLNYEAQWMMMDYSRRDGIATFPFGQCGNGGNGEVDPWAKPLRAGFLDGTREIRKLQTSLAPALYPVNNRG